MSANPVGGGRHLLEALEPRRLLTAFNVNGTPAVDTIEVRIVGSDVVAIVNGTQQVRPDAQVTSIVIDALGGADTITIHGNGDNPVTVKAGAGDDVIIVHANDGAAITVNGESNSPVGSDELRLIGTPSVTANYSPSGSATGTGSVIAAGKTINLLNIESLSASAFGHMQITPANADDTMRLDPVSVGTNLLSGTSGAITITPLKFTAIGTMLLNLGTNDAGAGNDELSFQYIPADELGAELFRVNAGTGSNRIYLWGGGPIPLDTGAGPLGGANVSVFGLHSSIKLNGSQTIGAMHLTSTAVDLIGSGATLNVGYFQVNGGMPEQPTSLNLSATQQAGIGALEMRDHLEKLGTGVLNIQSEDLHQAGATLYNRAGTVNFHSNAPALPPRWIAVESWGTTNFYVTRHLSALRVHAGTTSLMAGSRTMYTFALDVNTAAGAALDITDGALVIDYGVTNPFAQVRSAIGTGHAGGSWTGAGIRSSTAAANPAMGIGAVEASNLFGSFPAVFGNENINSTSILVRTTLNGDANLDGTVNLQDFNRLASNFGAAGSWLDGDFNYDGLINLQDFNRLASNFGRTM